jgi:acyl-CoA thioester hydrolase
LREVAGHVHRADTPDAAQAVAASAPRFAACFRVRHYESDALGHVNNAAYLHYLEQAAIEHSTAAGYSNARYREMGGLFVVRRHEIDYLRPAGPGDVLEVVTWAVELRGARAVRAYEIYRHGETEMTTAVVPADRLLQSDYVSRGELVVRAETLWVYVDVASGRPRRIPPALSGVFVRTSR